jgi:purine nucleosidase
MECLYERSNGKWIIDTDPGVDDAFALIYALTFLGDDLLAISVEAGNTGLEKCYINAKKVCAITGKDVPIYKGCKLNISNLSLASASHIHGSDGLNDIEKYLKFEEKYNYDVLKKEFHEKFDYFDHFSPLKIIELCYKHDNINLLTIGPLTNIAIAYMLDPNIVNRINKLVVMGGSYSHTGNITPTSEFNFAFDPISTKIVLDNFKNISIYPWETCWKHRLVQTELSMCVHENEKSHFCKYSITKKLSTHQFGVFPDYGAAISAFYPNSIKKKRCVYVDIVIDSNDFFGAFYISKAQHKDKNDRAHITLVEELEQKLFVSFFEKMIQ